MNKLTKEQKERFEFLIKELKEESLHALHINEIVKETGQTGELIMTFKNVGDYHIDINFLTKKTNKKTLEYPYNWLDSNDYGKIAEEHYSKALCIFNINEYDPSEPFYEKISKNYFVDTSQYDERYEYLYKRILSRAKEIEIDGVKKYKKKYEDYQKWLCLINWQEREKNIREGNF
jgi:hypothetical protein